MPLSHERTSRRRLAALLLLAIAAAVPAPPAVAAATIDIGVVTVFDFVTEWARRGAQMAIDDVNAGGGVIGRRLRLIFEHDTALGERGVRSLLARKEIEALIGPEVWTATQNNDQAIRNGKVINMLPLSPAGSLQTLRNPYVFRLLPSDATQADALIRHVVDERGLKRVAVLHADDFLGKAGAGEVRDRLRERGLRPSFESTFNTGDFEFTTQVRQAQRSGAEAVIVWGLAREAARVALTMRALGWKVPLAGPVEAVLGDYVEIAGPAAEGTIGVLPHKTINNWAPPGSWRANWFARYHRRYVVRAFRGTKVPNLPVAQAVVYDAVKMYADAVRAAGTTDGDAVRRVLESGRVFAGVTHDFHFSPASHETYDAEALWAFRIARGAINFDADPRADKRVETEAWQLFAAGLLFDRARGVAFIPYSIGVFDSSRAVDVGPFRWQVLSVRFSGEIPIGWFGLSPRTPRGRFAIVRLRVTNTSRVSRKAPWTFAIDQDGSLAIPDAQATAALWVNGGSAAQFFMFSPLPPGRTLEGEIAFDLPPTARTLQIGVPDGFIFQNYAMIRTRA